MFALCGILPSCSLIRKFHFEKTTGFDDDSEFIDCALEDSDLFFRLALVSAIHRISEPLVQYRVHPEQRSKNTKHGKDFLYRKWMNSDLLRKRHNLSDERIQRARAALLFAIVCAPIPAMWNDIIKDWEKGMAFRTLSKKLFAIIGRYVRSFLPSKYAIEKYF